MQQTAWKRFSGQRKEREKLRQKHERLAGGSSYRLHSILVQFYCLVSFSLATMLFPNVANSFEAV